jgi:hypothetical protein
VTARSSEGVRSTAHNPVQAPLAEVDLPRMMVPYFSTLQWKDRPQFSQLWTASSHSDSQYVDSQFGRVPKGSLLSYQMRTAETIVTSVNVVLPPALSYPDLSGYVMGYLPLSEQIACVYDSLFVSDAQSRDFEELTRAQSETVDWHKLRKNRLTASKFKRVCARRASFDKLADNLLKSRNVQTAAMKYGIEHEDEAAEAYATQTGRCVHRVGFVINPTCMFLGCSPDRRIEDTDDTEQSWGLLEIKCTTSYSIVECKYLQFNKQTGKFHLKQSHDYYYQIMGQLGLTGHKWCDLYVMSQSDFHIERICFDQMFFDRMMLQLCSFFFQYFLPCITA